MLLIAKHPDQPSSVYFDYLDIYKAARATFSRKHLLDLIMDNSWDKHQGFRSNHSERTREQWLEHNKHELCDPRRVDPRHRTYEHRHSPSPMNYIPCTSHYQCTNTHRLPVPTPPVLQLPLSNDQSTPSDSSRHRLRHGIDIWPAVQPQDAPAPSPAQVSSPHEAPSHIPHIFSNHIPSDCIKRILSQTGRTPFSKSLPPK